MVRQAGGEVATLLDRLRPHFGLVQVGSHRLRHRGRVISLFPLHLVKWSVESPEYQTDLPVEPSTLYEHSELVRDVQREYLMRNLVGIRNNRRDFRLVLHEGRPRLISYFDLTLCPAGGVPPPLPFTWFDTVSDPLRALLPLQERRDIHRWLHEIETTVRDFDSRYLFIRNEVLVRVAAKWSD